MLFSKIILLTLVLATSASATELRGAQDQRELNHLLADCTNCDNGSSGQCLQNGAGRVCWPAAADGACPHYAPTACDGTASVPAVGGCDACSVSSPCAHDGDGVSCSIRLGIDATCSTGTTDCFPAPASAPALGGCDLCTGTAVCAHDDGVSPCYDLQGDQCSPGTTLCPTCVNTATAGTDTDYGCSAAKPVCASDWVNEPNAGDEGTVCRTCINDQAGSAIDTGCSSSTPKCKSNSCSA
jgi:hypothetical protein